MIVLQAYNLKKSFGDKEVFTSISLTVNEKERVGLVGVNGSGKTTLLKCLTGELSPDEGEVIKSNALSLAYMEQLPQPEEGKTAWDAILDSFTHLLEKRKRLRELENEMSQTESNLDLLMDTYARLTEEYERANGYACENMARRILDGLGFSQEQYQQPIRNFSGGQKTRLNLGRLLAISPGILLLDEPTNHLDMTSVEWLEDYLQTYPGTVLLVSHDRMFLNKFADRILELKDRRLISYPGNYSNYLKIRAQNKMAEQRAYEKEQEYIKKTEDYIRKFKAGIKAKQARGRQSQLDRMERLERPARDEHIGKWKFLMNCESGQDVLKIANLSKSYENLDLLKDVDLSIYKGDKIALLGPNGCGKSTLLKIITGFEEADEGEIITGSRVEIAYFSQEYEELDYSKTLLDEIIYSFDITIEEARTVLGRMLFRADDVFKLIADLSGGEKGRLCLLKIILSGANFLILDEPTNHLDIESRQVVEELLADFPGTVLFVSHDRYFIDRIASRIVLIENKKLHYFWGNYSYYREKLPQFKVNMLEENKKKPENQPGQQEQFRKAQKEKEKIERRLQRSLQLIEKKIAELEERKTELEKLLSVAETYHDSTIAREYTLEYDEVQNILLSAYDEWELIAAEMERH